MIPPIPLLISGLLQRERPRYPGENKQELDAGLCHHPERVDDVERV